MGKHKHYDLIEEWARTGRTVQVWSPNLLHWKDCDMNRSPSWLEDSDYRLKPEPEYIPFDFSDAEKLIGKKIVSKVKKDIYATISYIEHPFGIYIPGKTAEWITFDKLFSTFMFIDGSPCGKLEE